MTDDFALKRMGAGKRDAPDGHNLDVSGTVGPDYLGQETVDVDGHPKNRPGVRSRLPETSDPHDPRISRMDTGEELPVLLSSDMRTDPIEATQGTFTEIVEGTCARCGYDRLKASVHTLAGEHQETCNACGAIQRPGSDPGYRMPKTRKDRAKRQKEAGPTIGTLTNREVVDLEPDTGFGAMVSLARDDCFTSLYKDDVEDLFWMLVKNDDIDITESVQSNMKKVDVLVLAGTLLPDGVEFADPDDDE